MRRPLVRTRDRLDDRQAEATAVLAPVRLGTAEALERALAKPLGEARPAVTDMELDDALASNGSQLHRAVAIAKGVVEQVAERLLEPEPVATHGQSRLVDMR